MAKWRALGVVVLLALLVFGEGIPSIHSEAARRIKIGVSFADLRNERWSREDQMMRSLCSEAGVQYMSQSANGDAALQMSQCENLISQGVDVLLIIPLDADSSAAAVKTAHENHVPVIAYDRLVRSPELDLYVSFDSIRVGEMMAEYVVKRAPRGNYIVLKGDVGDNNAHLVYQGNMKVLKPLVQKGDIKIVADQFCKDWSGTEALKHTENALTSVNNDVVAVITGYDGLATGAIQALEAQGLKGKVLVTGQDAELSACQRVVDGSQTMTIYKPLKRLAKAAIDAAIALAEGRKPAINGSVAVKNAHVNAILLDPIPVDAGNIVDAVIKDGFHRLEDVYKNVPHEKWPKIR